MDYARLQQWPFGKVTQILYSLAPCRNMVDTIKPETLRSNLSRLRDKKKKLKKGSTSYTTFMSNVFELCRGRRLSDVNVVAPVPEVLPVPPRKLPLKRKLPPPLPPPCALSTCEASKKHNLLQHHIARDEKRLQQLKAKISSSALRLSGHYNKKNIDKREKRATANQRELQKLKKAMEEDTENNEVLKMEIAMLKAENLELRTKHAAMLGKLKTHQMRTSNAQKLQSKYKMKLTAHVDCTPNSNVPLLRKEISEKNSEIHCLKTEIDTLRKDNPKGLGAKDRGYSSIPLVPFTD